MPESEYPKPLEGKRTGEDMKFEPTRLSYLSAEAVAEQLAAELASRVKGKNAVIVGAPLLADLTNLVSVLTTLDGVLQDYRSIPRFGRAMLSTERPRESVKEVAPSRVKLEEPVSLAAAANQVLGLISLFREDVEYKGVETVVDPLSFEIVLGSALKRVGADSVVVPDLFVFDPAGLGKGDLRKKLDDVHKAKSEAWEALAPSIRRALDLEADVERAHQASNEAQVNSLGAELGALRDNMDPVTERLSQADKRLTEVERSLEQTAEGQAMTGLGRLLRAEAILRWAEGSGGDGETPLDTVFVHAKIVASGGHQRIGRHLFSMLFLGDGISFLGGVVARWAVLGQDGSFDEGGIRQASFYSRFHRWWRSWAGAPRAKNRRRS